MPYGPCHLCGRVNYPNSLGGSSICPSCDAGNPPDFQPELRSFGAPCDCARLREENDRLRRKVNGAEMLENLEGFRSLLPPLPEDREIDEERLAALFGPPHTELQPETDIAKQWLEEHGFDVRDGEALVPASDAPGAVASLAKLIRITREAAHDAAIEKAAQIFTDYGGFRWLCLDHGGEEAERITEMIMTLHSWGRSDR